MTKRTIRAWAVLTPKDDKRPDELSPYGSRSFVQYPIFPTRLKAAGWKWGFASDRGRLVRVTIQIEAKKGAR